MRNKKILGLLLAGVMVTSIPFNVFADDGDPTSTPDKKNQLTAEETADEKGGAEKEVKKESPAEPTGEAKTDPSEKKEEDTPKVEDKKEEDKEEPKVTFNTNGGQGTVEVKKDNDGNVLEPTAPTKEGHDFLGWYVGENKADFPYEVKDKVEFIAKWKAKEFNVKFNSNGGTTIADKKVVYNNSVKKPDDPDKTGYKFKGWYTDDGVFVNRFKFDTKITGNVNLYAKWEEDKPAVPTKEDLYISDIEYDGNYVTGKVTSKGEPVYKATVTLKIDGSKTGNDDETDSNGRFKVYLGKYYDDYRYYYDDDYYYRDGYRYYDGYRVYSDSDGWYYYKNGRKRYIDYDYGYRRYRDYKADLVAEKDGFYSAEKNLWKDGYYYNNGRYYGRDWYSNKYDHRVYPTDISRTNYSASGYLKGYKTRTVYVYDDGTYLGSSKIDSDGYFNVTWNSPYVSTSRSLEYYVNGTSTSDSTYSMIPVVNALSAGASFVRGNAGAYADVTVYDSNGTRLGGATAGSTGIFNISLNRELKAGETIKVEAKESGKISRSTEVKIAGQEAKVTAEVNSPSYIAGYPDGTFKPGKEVTRAEAVRMFVSLVNNGKELPKNPTTKFKDANNKWYSDEINFAVSKGFISGYSDGTFKPNQGITRAEFAQMIAVFVKDGYPGSSNFKDVKGHWASNAIDQLYGNKTIKGFPDGTFKPNQKLTRAEAVTVLNSVFGRNTKATSFANVNTSSLRKFSDVPMSHWAYYEIIDASNGHNAVKGDKAEDVSVWQ